MKNSQIDIRTIREYELYLKQELKQVNTSDKEKLKSILLEVLMGCEVVKKEFS